MQRINKNVPTLTCVFAFATITSTFVNKYVLWVLKFTYPTVYQSWQMLFAFMTLLSASVCGYADLPNFDINTFRAWMPCTCLFALGIYSGSVALANLPIPVFCTLYNLTLSFGLTLENCSFYKGWRKASTIGLMVGGTGVLLSFISDPQFNYQGYRWMLVHTLSTAIYLVLSKRVPLNQLSDTDRMLYNSFFSFAYLMLLGLLTGETFESLKFSYLYYGRFHLACLTSGLLCGILGLTYCKLKSLLKANNIRFSASLVSVGMAAVSPLIFELTLTVPFTVGLALGLVGHVIHTYGMITQEDDSEEIISVKTTS